MERSMPQESEQPSFPKQSEEEHKQLNQIATEMQDATQGAQVGTDGAAVIKTEGEGEGNAEKNGNKDGADELPKIIYKCQHNEP